ncbi:MAG: hypothetical protein ACRD5K_01745 [Candidatus Acidiferrales bacterium]
MKKPPKNKKNQATGRPLERVPLRKLVADVKRDLRRKLKPE